MFNIILANLVRLFHIIVIIFVLIGPFSKNPLVLILHIVFCLCLMIHWMFNSDTCFLTLLETKIRGIDDNESFTYKFVAPMYNITHTKWNKLVWVITIIVCLIAVFNLKNSAKFKLILKELNNLNRNNKKIIMKKIIRILDNR